MNYRKRAKIETIIVTIITMLGFAVGGSYIGIFGLELEKRQEAVGHGQAIITMFIGLVLLYLAYFIQLCLHEMGHVLFGLMTGYRFSSLRFGKLMLVNVDGKLKFKIYSLPGTGGQALMRPPLGDAYDYPVFWYNAGGLIVNLILSVICGVAYVFLPSNLIYLKLFLMGAVLTGMLIFITNAIPFRTVGTDGANIATLVKNRDTRLIFRSTLEIAKNLSDGLSLKDMPESLFRFDKEMKMDNILTVSQAFNRFGYLMARKEFGEAYNLGQHILDNALVIVQVHELDLRAEMLYLLVVYKKDYEEAKKSYQEDKDRIRKIASLPAYQRSMYAYYKKAEIDEKKAAECLKKFEKLAKNYPYPEEIRTERELMEYVDGIE